jgi:cbb3-type cytochrome oxidase maturation protein
LYSVNFITKRQVNVIFVLIGVSLLVAIGFLITFIWTIRTGQFEDDYTPSVRILFDDDVNVMPDKRKEAKASESDKKSPDPIDNKPKT